MADFWKNLFRRKKDASQPGDETPLTHLPVDPSTLLLAPDLLQRAATYEAPPMLGPRGGLDAMTRTLPEAQSFATGLLAPHLPAETAQTPALLSDAADFPASLAALASFNGLPSTTGLPAVLPASETATVLPPIGSLPNQLPGLSGVAPILDPQTSPARLPSSLSFNPLPHHPEPFAPSTTSSRPTPVTSPLPTYTGPLQSLRAADAVAASLAGPSEFVRSLPVLSALAGPMAEEGGATQQRGSMATGQRGNDARGEGERRIGSSVAGGADSLKSPVQASAEQGGHLTPAERSSIESQRGSGAPLDSGLRAHYEQTYSQSFDDVRVHDDAPAGQTAERLDAVAFTTGADIFFAPGQFEPESVEGGLLLGHELAHVVQQRAGQVNGDPDRMRPPTDRLEREADRMVVEAAMGPREMGQRGNESPSTHQPVGRFPVDQLPSDRTPTAPLPVLARFSLGDFARNLPSLGGLASGLPRELPSVSDLTERLPSLPSAGGLMERLPSLASAGELMRNMPGASAGLEGLTRQLPIPGGLPSIGEAAGLNPLGEPSALLGQVAGGLPSPGGLMEGLGGRLGGAVAGGLPEMPNASGLVQSLAGQLPAMPSPGAAVQSLAGSLPLPEMPSLPGMPSLGGLGGASPPMPMPPSLGEVVSGMTGEGGPGREAIGQITGGGSAPPEPPAAPQMPDMDRLADQVIRRLRQQMRVERERTRGLA